MQKIVILGSTGSIGKNALNIVRCFPDQFQVVGLAAQSNYALLERQVKAFRPSVASLADKSAAAILAKRLQGTGTEVLGGPEGVIETASLPAADRVISAIVGSAGLLPTLAAIYANKTVALANKETIVMAGELVMREAKSRNVAVLPVDSEHSALFQLLENRKSHEIKRVILTASGGPLLRLSEQKKKTISQKEALAHPTWKMGPKISIDSATLMNKGFEMIEARWFFDLPESQIDVVIHPQSIVHSFVEFVDRSLIAQMGFPDMRIPIAYAMFHPHRESLPFKLPDLTAFPSLTFEPPKPKSFPLLTIAREALQTGGTMPAVLNRANESAVAAFLEKRIGFLDIHKIIRKVLDAYSPSPINTVDDVLLADRWAGLKTERCIQTVSRK